MVLLLSAFVCVRPRPITRDRAQKKAGTPGTAPDAPAHSCLVTQPVCAERLAQTRRNAPHATPAPGYDDRPMPEPWPRCHWH
jgi:hypothetical protein